ncbi:leukotriene A-4 hydrolase [Anabas testudineus]|uniref:Leukotriene A(4) hydrolase n=1 Tax=Anabas testudineus TaxID=64144 RepID=A0A3Q1H7F0_ANATE|nr:leukotriene A-4 hydrolase [Anabas testudineus]
MYPPDCLIVKRPVPDVSKPCSDRKPWQAAARCSLSVVTGPSIMSSDPCSFSSFTRCVTKHLNLSLHLDFERHVIRAKVELTVEALEDRFATLTLDTRDLKILSVSANGQPACFSLGPKHSFKGTPLDITLPFDVSRGQHVIVEVTYETSPSASALQWLTPEQTAGKKHPYLFSQCQAHHCRSMVPCQDSPSVKHTYYAQVSVPKDLVAVMSAVRDGQEVDPQDNNRIIYRFRQPVPMPSYLIAIVVGALESREIGPRSRVWSEKEFADKAAYEFSETETMLKTAEDLAGPYVWGQYDILVLPPSFPYGGMENPCLTFATPTLLAGDKSLSNVIAHEISHSWTGNLVTNKTWEHFWLNEGHTVYLERMIGRCMESEQFRQFKAIGGWKDLQDSVNTFGANNPLTNLVPSLQDVDPDDAFSSVPYEKGFALLYHLEELMGGPEVFMGFVKSYIQLFAYSSVTTEDWKNYLFTYFKDKVDILNKVDWNAWMFTPGMPPVKPQYDTTLADACIALSQRWTKAKEQDLGSFTEYDVKSLSSHQLIEFLSLLLQETPLPLTHVKKMQEVYGLNTCMNSEIRFRWLRLCVCAKWEEAVPLALKMATEQGRMKFTRPLFREVFNFEKYRKEAVRVFLAHRAAMHPVTAGLVAKDLKVDASNSSSL